MAKRTAYQERVIRDYYRNARSIALARLSELASELYLAEGRARSAAWKRIAAAMETLEVPRSRIEHLLKTDNPALVAALVQELHAQP
jgi:hypothetical protein